MLIIKILSRLVNKSSLTCFSLKQFFLVVSLVLFCPYLSAQILDAIEPSCALPINKDPYAFGQNGLGLSIRFNNRKFLQEMFKKIIQEKRYEKKWIKAEVTVSNDKSMCEFTARVRLSGDNLDHISLITPPSSSLLVELKNGAINGIRKFKLFLPVTRFGDNEIFSTLLFRKLGFLSPRTSSVDVNINGYMHSYIFQEDLQKEFLEFNKKKEGPILEGDERFGLGNPLSFARMLNSNWAGKSEAGMQIALASIELLNLAYLRTSRYQPTISKRYGYWLDLILDIQNYGYHLDDIEGKEMLQEFYALSYALNAFLGLSRDDSRFYFNPVFGRFEPIYYDAHPRPSEKLIHQTITHFVKLGIDGINKKINNIDRKKLQTELKSLGASYSNNDIEDIMQQIENNFEMLKLLPIYPDIEVDDRELFTLMKHADISEKFGGFLFILNSEHTIGKVCNLSFSDCNPIDLAFNDLKDAVSQRLIGENGKSLIYIGTQDLVSKKLEALEYPFSVFHWKKFPLDGEVTVRVSENIIVKTDLENKIINFEVLNSSGHAIFHGGSLIDWHINLRTRASDFKEIQAPIFTKSGLPGCLNFQDIEVKNISIEVDTTNCEDGISFLRAIGHLKHLKVENSFADAIDVDFSKLFIDDIEISKAGNDCVDFSGGTYWVDKINLSDCGDKGLSVGENSYLKVNELNIKKSAIGIAVKDSSIAEINKLFVIESDVCVAVYRKKEEFNGGTLLLDDVNCKQPNFFKQKNSSIIYANDKSINSSDTFLAPKFEPLN